jgi:hypothetical protein
LGELGRVGEEALERRCWRVGVNLECQFEHWHGGSACSRAQRHAARPR